MPRSPLIGTVEEALEIEEALLSRKLPKSFRDWLLENNGSDMEDIHIYPVRDERDTRKTWASLAYNLENEWADWLLNFGDESFSYLLPFADFGTGDFYCFDYSVEELNGEWPVVLWSHETGKTEFYACDFSHFQRMSSSV